MITVRGGHYDYWVQGSEKPSYVTECQSNLWVFMDITQRSSKMVDAALQHIW
jgi:hypothetical protein